MTPLAWVLGLMLPACGADGIAGLPMPQPIDMAHIERPASPNSFLAGPADMTPAPDMIIPQQGQSAAALYETVRIVFAHQPRTFVAAEFPHRRQLHYVVRSAALNFPDLVTVQVDADGPAHSQLSIWSRSVYGRSDFGVNRTRTKAWLDALRQFQER